MNESPKISESEWEVANVVWQRDGLSATEIARQLMERHPWKLKTINTFLVRLVQKGVLRIDRSERPHRYFAKLARERCVCAESQSFLARVFGGSVAPLVAHFCETADLTDEEVASLKKILSQRSSPKTKKKPQ